MKLESFCKVKGTLNRTKWQLTEWGKIFTNHTSDRGLFSEIDKELKKLDIKKPNNPTKKWGTDINRILNRRISNGRETLKEMFTIFILDNVGCLLRSSVWTSAECIRQIIAPFSGAL